MPPDTVVSTASSNTQSRNKFLVSALNGTALYVLAYFVVWGLHDLAKVGVAQYYHLRGNWDPSRIVFTLADAEWWRTAIVAVYGIGPLVSLLLGFAAFWWYWKHERASPGHFKLLLLWIVLHAANAVFGALLSDTFIQTGSWYVPDWLLRQGNALNVLVALLAGIAQLVIGYFGAIPFLQAHDSKTVMRFVNRQLMVISTLIVPWAMGGICIALSKLGYLSLYETLHLLIMGLLVTPMALGCLNDHFSSTVKKAKGTHVVWGMVLLALLTALLWRMLLSPPVLVG